MIRLYVGAGIVIVIALLMVVFFSGVPNSGIKDSASALLLISGTAVAIERVMEILWSFVDLSGKSFWPFTKIDAEIKKLVDNLTGATDGPIKNLLGLANNLKADANWTNDEVAKLQADMETWQKELDTLRSLAPTNHNAQAIAAFGSQKLATLKAKYPLLATDADLAKQACDAVSDFVGSLVDNPGRRIISIYLGVLLGLAVAYLFGLDVFAATLGQSTQTSAAPGTLHLAAANWTIAATGIVMGLGSNPTHELIKALQTFKQSQAAKS